MPGGRPTDYGPDILKKTEAYLRGCNDEYITAKVKGSTHGVQRFIVRFPSIGGLASNLSVARSSIYKWRDEHKEFSDILEKILAEQESRLLERGLSGEYNPAIAKLVLGKHGYRDVQELTGVEGKDLFTKDEKDNAEKAIGEITGK